AGGLVPVRGARPVGASTEKRAPRRSGGCPAVSEPGGGEPHEIPRGAARVGVIGRRPRAAGSLPRRPGARAVSYYRVRFGSGSGPRNRPRYAHAPTGAAERVAEGRHDGRRTAGDGTAGSRRLRVHRGPRGGDPRRSEERRVGKG